MPEPSRARSYRFHPDAYNEFIEQLERLHAEDPATAQAFEEEVSRAIDMLLQYSESAPIIAERRGRMIRRKVLTHSRYNLHYFLQDNVIRISAVAHQHRKPGYWLSRLRKH